MNRNPFKQQIAQLEEVGRKKPEKPKRLAVGKGGSQTEKPNTPILQRGGSKLDTSLIRSKPDQPRRVKE